jgi:hypothetical protein
MSPPRRLAVSVATKTQPSMATNLSTNTAPSGISTNAALYGKLLLFIAGMGGLLYGIDVGIIAAALLYLSKTINLTVEQTSIIVAAVLAPRTGARARPSFSSCSPSAS